MKKAVINYSYRGFPVLLLVLLSSILTVSAQTGTSVLQGEITTIGPDGSSLSLPAAKVVLTGEADTKTITVVAGDTGNYKFLRLKAGRYALEVSQDGFLALKKTVIIGENQTVSENVTLQLKGIAASVTIDSEAEVINTTDSSVAATINTKTLQNVPLANELFQDALPLVPGVVRGPDGLINVKGAQSSQSGILAGSSNGDDPVSGNIAINLPLEAVKSVDVISNPYSAEYGNFNGGVVQIQTQSGSDKWKFGLDNFLPRLRNRDGGIRGIESATPRANFGGPLKKDKLFLFQSFQYRFVQTEVESLPELERDTKLESFDSFTRIDYNFTDLHRFNATFALFPQKIDFINLNTFNPQNSSANFHQRGWMFALNDQYVTTGGGILQTNFSVKQADADVFANSGEAFTIAPQVNSGGFFNRQNRDALRYEGQSIYSLPQYEKSGQHSFKFGGGFAYSTFDGTNTNRLVQIARADGTINQTQTYLGSGALSRNKSEFGVFVQDKWTINPQLTFDFGARFDRDSLSKTLNPAPRVGFVVSPFQDNKTVIRGGAGVFFSKVSLNTGVFEQNQDLLIRRFANDGMTALGETLFRNVLESGDIETPYSIGWNLQFDREISERLFVRASYNQRETRRDFILNPFIGTTPNEGIYQLGNGGSSSYRELSLMTRVRLQENRDLFFSYTRSRTVGDLNTFGNFRGNIQNPILRTNEYSRLAFDVPNRLLFWGEFGLPLKVTFLPIVDWRSGFPFSIVDENQNFIGARNAERRFPNFFSTDIQVQRIFKVRFRKKEYSLRAGVKFFNLTNHFNPRDVQNNIDSPDFGGLFNGVGRQIRFTIKFLF